MSADRPDDRRLRRKDLDPARVAARDTLRAVRERDAYANLVLPKMLRERHITGRDAALAVNDPRDPVHRHVNLTRKLGSA